MDQDNPKSEKSDAEFVKWMEARWSQPEEERGNEDLNRDLTSEERARAQALGRKGVFRKKLPQNKLPMGTT